MRVAAVQNSIVADTSQPVAEQREAIHSFISKMIHAAAESKVNILCFQEAWSKFSTNTKIIKLVM